MAVHKLSVKTRRPDVETTPSGKKISNATSGANVRVLLDGEPLRSCHKLTFEVQAGKVARVVLEMLAEVEIELDADADFFDAEPGAEGAIGPSQLDGILERDDIKPKGTVQVKCQHRAWAQSGPEQTCRSEFWVDALDKRLPDGPFFCYDHSSPEERAIMDQGLKAPTPSEALHGKVKKES